MELEPQVHSVYEATTRTWQFVVADPSTKHAVIIDPVLDAAGSSISTTAADNLLSIVRQNDYHVERILETRGAGAGKSAAWYLRTQLHQRTGSPPRVSMGKSFAGVQRMFARKYGIQDINGGTMDSDFKDGQVMEIGKLRVHVWQLPTGVEDDHLGFLVGTNIFIGERSLTAESANIDFENESSHVLWTSIQRLLSLPAGFRVYFSRTAQQMSGQGKASVSVEELRTKCKRLMSQ